MPFTVKKMQRIFSLSIWHRHSYLVHCTTDSKTGLQAYSPKSLVSVHRHTFGYNHIMTKWAVCFLGCNCMSRRKKEGRLIWLLFCACSVQVLWGMLGSWKCCVPLSFHGVSWESIRRTWRVRCQARKCWAPCCMLEVLEHLLFTSCVYLRLFEKVQLLLRKNRHLERCWGPCIFFQKTVLWMTWFWIMILLLWHKHKKRKASCQGNG